MKGVLVIGNQTDATVFDQARSTGHCARGRCITSSQCPRYLSRWPTEPTIDLVSSEAQLHSVRQSQPSCDLIRKADAVIENRAIISNLPSRLTRRFVEITQRISSGSLCHYSGHLRDGGLGLKIRDVLWVTERQVYGWFGGTKWQVQMWSRGTK